MNYTICYISIDNCSMRSGTVQQQYKEEFSRGMESGTYLLYCVVRGYDKSGQNCTFAIHGSKTKYKSLGSARLCKGVHEVKWKSYTAEG